MRCNPTSMCPTRLVAAMGPPLAIWCWLAVAVAHGDDGATADVPDAAAVEAAAVEAAVPAGEPCGLRVRIKLDVSGELLAGAGPDAPPLREPVEMEARFDFLETAAGAAGAGAIPAVCRSYRDATASMRVGGGTTTTTLAADARRIQVVRQGTTPVPYLADGFLSGEESDLLETPFDALLLDELRPGDAVAIGQAWEIPADVTAGLLAIDTVESGAIEARLHDVADGRAKVMFSGIVDGAADGVPTHVTVEGSFTVAATGLAAGDLAVGAIGAEPGPDQPDQESAPSRYEFQGPVSQVSAVIRERRQASHVAPGFEVEARLTVARAPLGTAVDGASPASTEEPSVRRRGEGGPGRVWYRDPQGRFDLVHDARWRRVEDGETGLVMRMVDRGALVGQCSITSLPEATTATLPTREDVQRDVETSLAGQVVRSDAAEESDRPDGLRIVRVASSGTAGRLPFRWIHYVVAAQDGRRVSVTFMCEESMVQRFGNVDRRLIEEIRLPATGPNTDRTGTSGPTAGVPGRAGSQTR